MAKNSAKIAKKAKKQTKSACIVLPTYNEAQNIEHLLKEIFSITKSIKNWNIFVLVVDDKSPDGTGKIVKKLQNKYPKLHLLEGNKQGLGVAYVRGFKYAIKKFEPDVLFEMDADFSHPPKLIPKFLSKITQGADFVVGSRYVKGGATPDWGITRKIISKGGNFFARVVAGIYKIHDCTSGYRAIRTDLLKKMNLDLLGAKGYSFQMNLLYEAKQKKAKFSEIPLVFPDRTKGKSKMSHKDLIEFFFNSFRLRLRTWDRLIKFCIVGGTGVIVNTGVLFLLTDVFHITYMISSIFAIELAILWNFFLNNIWTFKKSTNKSSIGTKILKFHGVSIIGALINWGILVLFTDVIFHLYYIISNLIGIAVATAWNYLVNTYYTWRDEKE